MKHTEDAAMRAYYRRRLEFERSREIVARMLPPPPTVIADIGGGPGRYARRLSDLGYTVEHRDIFPHMSSRSPRWMHPRYIPRSAMPEL
ncbi:MAG: class I SAM-dependent methyltransferase [Mycobacteriaceae bacterium]|nr:class I SAM-dependent methyltransferase [Mycobacteriaceae bacterium]